MAVHDKDRVIVKMLRLFISIKNVTDNYMKNIPGAQTMIQERKQAA